MTTTSFEGDVGYALLWAGESVAMVQNVEPAAEIARRLAQDASKLIEADGTTE